MRHNALVICARPTAILRTGKDCPEINPENGGGAANPFRRLIGPRTYLALPGRLAWLAVGIACTAVLGLALYLTPDPRGHGTHEALGLPPCGFIVVTGLPCPTCGMTTAFSLMMHGRPLAATIAQPAGAVICILTGVLLIASFHAAGRGYIVSPNWDRIGPVRFMLCFGLVLLAGWGFKIALGLLDGSLPARW